MAKVIPLKQALVFWIATIGSAILLYYGGELSDFLISDSHASTWVRWAGVLVAPLTVIPWVIIIAITVSVVDEYYRRIVLMGTAIAFLLDLLIHIAANTAIAAQLLTPALAPPELVAAIISWMIGVSGSVVYHRYRL